MMKSGRIRVLGLAVITMFMLGGLSEAAMMGGGGMMGGGENGPFATGTNGSFGMMNGMSSSPVVGDDGTAYFVVYDTSATPGTTPASNVFQSRVIAIDLSGNTRSLTLNGIVSRPVVSGNYLLASASMADMLDFMLVGNYRNNQGNGQSVVYVMPVNFTSSTKPAALAIDGEFASVPVVANNHFYIVGSDFGNAMMTGSNTFNMMYGNYNFNNDGNAKTYMYIFNLDGSLVSKTLIQ